jgi:NTP pyrophosphatase (non-canonical NTP hydrolase)
METTESHNSKLTGKIDIGPDVIKERRKELGRLVKTMQDKLATDLDDYQTKAMRTAIFPTGNGMEIIYPTIGLCGEVGEIAEKVKKWIRDDKQKMTEERRQLLKKELGDALWYLSALAFGLGFTLREIAQHNLDKLHDRHKRDAIVGDGDVR